MSQNWKTYKLSELTSVITKGTTPSTHGYEFEASGVNFIKAESLNYDGRVDESAFAHISEEANEKLKRSQLKEKDILFSMAGAYLGKVGMVKANHCPANTNQAVGIIRIDNENVDHKFVEYSLRNPSTVNYVNSQSGQSAQPNINLAEIGALSFSFPPLSEQISIARILSALDDKIELNLAMNRTLEDMAMALYKHWFVDFGPFQHQEFIDSELGRIPKGWEV
jgi:type I restriction enzyme, S subunit